MEPGSQINVLRLFKAPSKWCPEHLTGLNIEQHDHASAAAIFDDALLPKDDDSCTVRSASALSNVLN